MNIEFERDKKKEIQESTQHIEYIIIDGVKFRVNDIDYSGRDCGFLINGHVWLFIKHYLEVSKESLELGDVEAYSLDIDTNEIESYKCLNITLVPFACEVMDEWEYKKIKEEQDALKRWTSKGWMMFENGVVREAHDDDKPKYMFWQDVPKWADFEPDRFGFNDLDDFIEKYIVRGREVVISISYWRYEACSSIMSFWNEEKNGNDFFNAEGHDERVTKYNTWWVEGYIKNMETGEMVKYFKDFHLTNKRS